MDIKTDYKSAFSMDHLYIKEFKFSRNKEIGELSLKLDISSELIFAGDSDRKAQVILALNIFEEDCNNLALNITAVGEFSLEPKSEVQDETAKALFKQNTLAAMFPFVRSQVALLTAQPDLSPLILPMININSLVSEEK